jgi:hypothetical protein
MAAHSTTTKALTVSVNESAGLQNVFGAMVGIVGIGGCWGVISMRWITICSECTLGAVFGGFGIPVSNNLMAGKNLSIGDRSGFISSQPRFERS